MVWLLWPVSVAVMSRIGRYLLYEVAALARFVSVAAMSRVGGYLLCEEAVLARIAGRYEPRWPFFAVRRGCSGPYRWPL